MTPPLGSGCLAGVTRALLLEWTDAAEAVLPIAVLATATEVFLASTTRDVQPVRRVDGRDLVSPGPTTRRIATQFAVRCESDVDP